MRYVSRTIAALFCILLAASPAGSGSMTLLGVGKPSAGVAYTGPKDITNTWAYWYGFRGISAADTSPAANVCLPADTTCADITLSSGSPVIPGSLSTCNNSTVQCTVKTMYDKGSAAINVINATIGTRPLFVTGCQNGLPCMKCVGASSTSLTGGSSNTFLNSQPYSVSSVFQRTSVSLGFYFQVGDQGMAGGSASSDTHEIYMSSVATATATDNAFHAIETVGNGASSTIMVDGSSTTVSAGSTVLDTTTPTLCRDAFNQFTTGLFLEAGFSTADITSVRATLNTQQHTFWNF